FRENENIPPYLFMSIIVALFIGLSVSAEEIFRDRKILKREAFLNLSRSSYLFSKIAILFAISAIQTLCFVLIGNSFLGIKGLYLEYWALLLSVSFFANILGLNISSAFNSAVSIYILIPLLVIPQMILGGAMFSFDKLNSAIGGGNSKTPIIADVMVSRWAYEALAVTQFKNSRYGAEFYESDRMESIANYKQAFYIPELKKIVKETRSFIMEGGDSSQTELEGNISLLRKELEAEEMIVQQPGFEQPGLLLADPVDHPSLDSVDVYLEALNESYISLFNTVNRNRDQHLLSLEKGTERNDTYNSLYDDHYNDFLGDVVKKTGISHPVVRGKSGLIQIIDPIFRYPEVKANPFRSHFFAPVKYLAGFRMETFYFNLLVIWTFSFLLYVTLYFDALRRLLTLFGKIQRRWMKQHNN
ncbi:MAG: ABC transporter permease, partial [Bacteroidales bacterium]|nr:ABC transporter permease [Bacteroidales bacterium]